MTTRLSNTPRHFHVTDRGNAVNEDFAYAGALPDGETRSDGYAVGDIAYWPPRGSLVILYAQNGERFERVHLGHIDGGAEIFRSMGDADVTFELLQ